LSSNKDISIDENGKWGKEIFMLSVGTKDYIVGNFLEEYHKLLQTNKQKHLWS